MLVPVIIILMLFPVGSAWGHGYGVDTTPTIRLPEKDIVVTVELPMDFEEAGSKRLTITATDTDTNQPVEDITYVMGISHAGKTILSDNFFAPDGILAIDTTYAEDPIQIHGSQDGPLGAYSGDVSAPLEITGPVFGSGGLYTFEITILAESENMMENPVPLFADLTLVDTTEFIDSDLSGQDVKFRLKSYFDKISNFEYDPENRQLAFEMQFDWSDKRMSHIPVVHEEVHFPKDFAEFLYPSYTGKANGIDLFKGSVVVDDYTEDDERIVHFVLLQEHLRFLKNQQKATGEPLPDSLIFTLQASEEIKFPLTAFTKSEDFQVDLSWDPEEIEPGKKATFIFTIRNGATGEPMRNSDYTFVLVQNGKEIHRVSGQAQVGGYFETYEFAEDQTGPTIIRFEDIRNSGQQTEFGLVVVPEFGHVVMMLLVAGMAVSVLGSRRRLFRAF